MSENGWGTVTGTSDKTTGETLLNEGKRNAISKSKGDRRARFGDAGALTRHAHTFSFCKRPWFPRGDMAIREPYRVER
jgi:hypothetical protein